MMNKENILIFNFEANKPPVFKEERGKTILYMVQKHLLKTYIQII